MQNVRVRFAYKRGFRRTWIVLSSVWVVLALFQTWHEGLLERPAGYIMVFGPPVLLYLIGAALVWIIEGFARPD